MEEMTYEEKMQFIGRLTKPELYEVMYGAILYHCSIERFLNSPWATEIRQRVVGRERFI